jgi:hypothetical protein
MDSLRVKLNQKLAKFQTDLHAKGVIAYVGKPDGTLYDSSNPGHVWVSTADMPPVSVLNKRIVVKYGMPVVVGFDPHEPATLQILSGGTVQQDMYAGQTNPITSFNMTVAPHAGTHTLYGGDTVWVDKRMITQSRLTAATYYSGSGASGSAAVAVLPDLIYYSGNWINIPYQVFDLTAYIPGSGSSCMVAASYAISGSAATVQFTAGSVAAGFTPALSQYPVIPAGNIMIGAVRLWGGMTFTHEDKDYTDFVDGRTFLAQGGSGSGGGGGGMTNPMTTLGDLIWAGAGGTPTRLPLGSSGYALQVFSGSPAWRPFSGTVSGGTNYWVTVYNGASSITGRAQFQFDLGSYGLRIDRQGSPSAPSEPLEVVTTGTSEYGGTSTWDTTLRLRAVNEGPVSLGMWAASAFSFLSQLPDNDGVRPYSVLAGNFATDVQTTNGAFTWYVNNGDFAMKLLGNHKFIINYDVNDSGANEHDAPAFLDVKIASAWTGALAFKVRNTYNDPILAAYDDYTMVFGNYQHSDLVNTYNAAILYQMPNQYFWGFALNSSTNNFIFGVTSAAGAYARLEGRYISTQMGDENYMYAVPALHMYYDSGGSTGYIESATAGSIAKSWHALQIKSTNFEVQYDGRSFFGVSTRFDQWMNLPNAQYIAGANAANNASVQLVGVDSNNFAQFSPGSTSFYLGGKKVDLSDTTNGHVLTYNSGSSTWTGAAPGAGGGLVLDPATPQPIGTAAVGSSGSASHGNHVHAHGSLAGGTFHNLASGGSAGFMPTLSGVPTQYLNGSGGWSVPASAGGVSLGNATPQPVGTAAVGSSGSASHEDHVHTHGAQVGGALHNLATSGSPGFLPTLSGNPSQYLSGSGTFTVVQAIGATSGSSLAVTGALTSSGGGIGYVAGAGGSIGQATSRATGVTLNKYAGTITMFSGSQGANAVVSFVFTNSVIAATDFVNVQHNSSSNGGAWSFSVLPAAGSCTISVRNISGATITEATPLRFAVIKGATT